MAAGLAAMVGLVAQLIRIEGHLAALRQAMPKEAKAKAKAKAKSPKAKQAKRRG